jgi:hypothetical protein
MIAAMKTFFPSGGPFGELLSACAVLIGVACAGEPTDGGPSGEGEGEGDADSAIVALTNTTEISAPLLVVNGLAVAARSDGRFAVAYFTPSPRTVECQLTGGGNVQGVVYELHASLEETDGTVRDVIVDDNVPNNKEASVSMAVDGGGALLIAYNGGDVTRTYCGASDLRVAVESGAGFILQTAATVGDTGATCRGDAGGDPYCGQGEVVGLYPAIAAHDGDVAIAYLDTHFGFADADINQSDLELARGTASSLMLSSINTETGAGYHATAAFSASGKLIVGHNVQANNRFRDDNNVDYTVSDGLWVGVEDATGVVVDQVLLPRVRTASRVAVGAVGDVIHVAFHDRSDEQLLLFTSVDDGATFSPRPIEQRGRSGRDPNVLDVDGNLILVYAHCRDDENGDGCSARDDGVRIARVGSTSAVKQDLRGDDEDLEAQNVIAAKSGAREFVVASVNTSRSVIVIQRVELLP